MDWYLFWFLEGVLLGPAVAAPPVGTWGVSHGLRLLSCCKHGTALSGVVPSIHLARYLSPDDCQYVAALFEWISSQEPEKRQRRGSQPRGRRSAMNASGHPELMLPQVCSGIQLSRPGSYLYHWLWSRGFLSLNHCTWDLRRLKREFSVACLGRTHHQLQQSCSVL